MKTLKRLIRRLLTKMLGWLGPDDDAGVSPNGGGPGNTPPPPK